MNSELVLVDDDKVLLLILQKMIHIVKPGFRLISFSSDHEALAYLSENPSPGKSRTVMLDINLGEMNAWKFMDELMGRAADCPKIILMTSSVSSSNLEKVKKYSPVIGFFEKPITIEITRQIFELINMD